jgi:hypothetical protein
MPTTNVNTTVAIRNRLTDTRRLDSSNGAKKLHRDVVLKLDGRTPVDWRELTVEESPEPSTVAIAEKIGVSSETVKNARQNSVLQPEKRIGRELQKARRACGYWPRSIIVFASIRAPRSELFSRK